MTNPLNRPLLPGQYQIGNFIFGAHTNFRVDACDVGAYDVNVQDYQRSSSDENQFGSDTLKPMPLMLTINALQNHAMPHIAALTKDFRELNFSNDRQPGIFAREWRADDVRHKWGELKPMKICRAKDGTILRVYGRPGKCAVTPLGRAPNDQAQQITAEFRRSDTLYYSDFEWVAHTRPNEIQSIVRLANQDMGDADSWLRFILIGPMSHPIIQLGFETIELAATIPVGGAVEISSYPWARRAIDLNSGVSLNRYLTRPYLDKLLFETNSIVEFSWNASGLRLGNDAEDIDFQGYDVNTMNAGWTFNYLGPGEGSIAPRMVFFPNVFRICLAWHDTGNQWRLGTMIRKRKLATDWQRVGFRMAAPAESSLVEEECANRIIARSNASGTRYSYWDITFTRCWFGIHVDGEDYPQTGAFPINRVVWQLNKFVQNFNAIFGNGQHGGAGWDYDAEFGTGDNLFMQSLWINGYRVAAADCPGAGFIGTEYRHPGMGMRATQRFLGQSTPGPIATFRARDNFPPELAEEIEAEYQEQFGSIEFSKVYLFWRDAWQTL